MNLGAFCMSLTVKDAAASMAFYEKLGFVQTSGDLEQNWVVMRNGGHVVGLFEGMFDKNMLTFNPGWDQEARETDSFTDVRELQKQLEERGIEILTGVDGSVEGPASIVIADPDGNPILIDQHR